MSDISNNENNNNIILEQGQMEDINMDKKAFINMDQYFGEDIMKYIERLYKNKKVKGTNKLPENHEKMRKKKRRMQKQARKK
jgi:hypothetical protein